MLWGREELGDCGLMPKSEADIVCLTSGKSWRVSIRTVDSIPNSTHKDVVTNKQTNKQETIVEFHLNSSQGRSALGW